MRKLGFLIAIVLTTSSFAQDLEDGLYAKFKTTAGDITCMLEFQKVPMTVGNFVGLCEGDISLDGFEVTSPYYDGVVFHRVVPNFVIQAGQKADGSGPGPGYKFPDEFDSTLMHTGPGILSMANAGPGTNSSQFFITHTATPHLNFRHSVFGHVVEGQDVVNKIQQAKDTIKTVEIIRVGKKAKKFNAQKTFTSMVLEKRAEEAEALANRNGDFKSLMAEKYPDAVQTESGLMYQIIQEGNGTYAEKGQTVSVHYTGTFTDGKKFDSSVDRGTPFKFPVGTGRVIKGWDEGIPKCDVGGKIKLIIPYWLAYGENGRSSIPPKAHLIFDVEMLGVE